MQSNLKSNYQIFSDYQMFDIMQLYLIPAFSFFPVQSPFRPDTSRVTTPLHAGEGSRFGPWRVRALIGSYLPLSGVSCAPPPGGCSRGIGSSGGGDFQAFLADQSCHRPQFSGVLLYGSCHIFFTCKCPLCNSLGVGVNLDNRTRLSRYNFPGR